MLIQGVLLKNIIMKYLHILILISFASIKLIAQDETKDLTKNNIKKSSINSSLGGDPIFIGINYSAFVSEKIEIKLGLGYQNYHSGLNFYFSQPKLESLTLSLGSTFGYYNFPGDEGLYTYFPIEIKYFSSSNFTLGINSGPVLGTSLGFRNPGVGLWGGINLGYRFGKQMKSAPKSIRIRPILAKTNTNKNEAQKNLSDNSISSDVDKAQDTAGVSNDLMHKSMTSSKDISKNGLSIELLGGSPYLSLKYETFVTDRIEMGVGIGPLSLSGGLKYYFSSPKDNKVAFNIGGILGYERLVSYGSEYVYLPFEIKYFIENFSIGINLGPMYAPSLDTFTTINMETRKDVFFHVGANIGFRFGEKL